MNKAFLLNDLAQLFSKHVCDLGDDYMLEQDEYWDSLSIVSTVGSIDQHYQVSISGIQLMECKSIGDIFRLIEIQLLTENV